MQASVATMHSPTGLGSWSSWRIEGRRDTHTLHPGLLRRGWGRGVEAAGLPKSLHWLLGPCFCTKSLHAHPHMCIPSHPLINVKDINKHLFPCPHYTDGKTEAQGSQRGMHQAWIFLTAHMSESSAQQVFISPGH